MPVENTNLGDINLDMFKSFYERRTYEKLEELNIPLEKVMSNLKSMEDGKSTLAVFWYSVKNRKKKSRSL